VILASLVSLIWAIKNLMRVDHQGWFNNVSAIYQLASTAIIIISIIIMSPEVSTSKFVWTEYHNETGMPNAFYVCSIGLLMCLYSFSGYEGGAHMAEETRNAASSAPRGIILTCFATGLIGLIYIVGLLYACNNKIVEQFHGDSDYPVVNIYI
jgi:amino acid transporter